MILSPWWRPIRSRLQQIPGSRRVAAVLRVLFSPRYRSEWRLKRNRPGNLFQPYSYTEPDRYPDVFAVLKCLLAPQEEPHLLSFGCSIGEEILSLHRVLPQARITGIDINPLCVARCRRRMRRAGLERVEVLEGDGPPASAVACYDAILCMAVFRHGELGAQDAPRCDHLIRFADFERTLLALNRALKAGGLLAIAHSNFRLADTILAGQYEVLLELDLGDGPPLYGRDDRRLDTGPYRPVLFRKTRLSAASPTP